MKHIFYLIYVLAFSGAVFVSGMFMGQWLERAWSRREAKVRLEAANTGTTSIGVNLQGKVTGEQG